VIRGVTLASVLAVAVPSVHLVGSAKVSSRGVATVKLSCKRSAGSTCAGKLSLSLVIIKRHRRLTVKFGSASYRVAAGALKALKIKLRGPGRKLLEHAHRHRLVVTATVRPKSGGPRMSNLTLAGASSHGSKGVRRA
jgi:hypothetical protein